VSRWIKLQELAQCIENTGGMCCKNWRNVSKELRLHFQLVARAAPKAKGDVAGFY
jgi:hypothetical protein